jgi:spore germination protein (amino acid permease)
MENTRIGKPEAIALILTIMLNHAILNISKSILSSTKSSALLNTLYISIIALILSYIIYILLNKFPTFDILDISNFLGGKILKTIIGVLFFVYFLFFSATLLKNFVYALQIIYYPNTNTFFLIILFLIGAVFVCNLKYDALYRSNLLILPFSILSILVLFLGNAGEYTFENVFPILGNGINTTFLSGISNLFAFQGLLYILFLPPHLKDVTELKKITFFSILFSALYLLISVTIILLLFDTEVSNTLLMPLYSAVRYIEFGTFFQRLDSVFILTWIISFVSYLSITINTCCNILKKITPIKSIKFSTILISSLMLVISFFSTTYAFSTFLTEIVYKYAFLIITGISIAVLFIGFIFKKIKSKQLNNLKPKRSPLAGGVQ